MKTPYCTVAGDRLHDAMTTRDDTVAEDGAAASWLQKVGVLCFLPRVLVELGVDPAPVLAAAGLPSDALARPEGRIPFESATRVLREAARRSMCAHLGVLVGSRFRLSVLGPLGELAAHSATVGDALRSYVVHQRLYSQGFAPFLHGSRGRSQFGAAIFHPAAGELSLVHDTLLAAATSLIRDLLHEDWVPTEVHLPHAPPPDAGPFLQHFRCRLRFDSDQAMLVFPSRELKRRVVDADPARLRALEVQAGQDMDAELLPNLYRALRLLLLQGHTTAASLAQSLAMHERTLARRLRAKGTSFQAVLDGVRYEAARQLLLESNQKVASIAAALGYADGAAFNKAFRRWAGRGPREWRLHARQPAERPARLSSGRHFS